ncbi:MAG: stage II sporulation protein D [Firmicutes bacterium]|nr:stage II sporulation protein D [Bacillota bacterium]
MHRFWLTWTVAAAILLVALPAWISRGWRSPGAEAPPRSSRANDLPVTVYFPETGRVATMPLSEYLVGVGAGELPPSFADEAIRAVLVAARTYTVRRMRQFGGKGCDLEPRADICASAEYGQAYLDWPGLREKLGEAAARRFWSRLQAAEEATRGLILTYQGAPIDAIYHSTSGRWTEDAQVVWGRPVPYLRPVPDPWGQEAPQYTETRTYGLQELAQALGVPAIAVPAGGGAPPIRITGRTPSGRVAGVQVGSVTFTGVEFRSRLGLRSTDFTLAWRDGQVVITTSGYGHGVGLSQWGANGMARRGAGFREILAHYYPGTAVEPLFAD